MSNTPNTPAGWYPDANKPGNERWWDGTAWGEQSRPVATPGAQASAPASAPTSGPVSGPVSNPVAAPVASTPMASAPTAASGTEYPQAGAPAPDLGKKKSKMGTGVLLGVLAAVVLLVGGCVAVGAVMFVGGDVDETVLIDSNGETADGADDSTDSSSGDGTTDEATADGTAPDEVVVDGDEESGDTPADDSDEAGDSDTGEVDTGETSTDPMDSVVSCSRPDSDTAIVEMVNTTGELTSFLLTVGYFDEAGQRLTEETGFVSYLRPGETARENLYLFEDVGTTCEILQVELIPAVSQQEALDDVGACEILAGGNDSGTFDATVTATNSSPDTLDYVISMAFVGPDGIRRSGATTFIEGVRAAETAPGEVFSPVPYAEGFTCEIVGAYRS